MNDQVCLGTPCGKDILPSLHSLFMLTRPAHTAPLSLDGIGFVKGMPVNTVGLPCALGANTFSAQDVFRYRDRFHMARIHAATIPTKVVNGQPFGDRPDSSFVSPPMCPDDSSITGASDVENSITVRTASSPKPARAKVGTTLRDWAVFIHLRPEAGGGVADAPSFPCRSSRAAVGAETLALNSRNVAPLSCKWFAAVFAFFGNLDNSQDVNLRHRFANWLGSFVADYNVRAVCILA